MSELEANKRNAQAFYDLMFNQSRPRDAIANYVGDEYIVHNPGMRRHHRAPARDH